MLVPVPATDLDQWWPKIELEVARALKRGNRYTVGSVKESILNRNMQLWLAIEDGRVLCVCITEILTYPLCKVMSVFVTIGREHHKWAHYMLGLNEWAKANGCTVGESWARPGWYRVLKNIIKGLRMPHVHLEWDIA